MNALPGHKKEIAQPFYVRKKWGVPVAVVMAQNRNYTAENITGKQEKKKECMEDFSVWPRTAFRFPIRPDCECVEKLNSIIKIGARAKRIE